MDQFDEHLKALAKEEPFPIPEGYEGRIFQICAAIEEKPNASAAAKPRRRVAVWAAAVLALFVTIPNLSPTAAAVLSEAPVLGPIVRLVTVRNYVYDDGHGSADVDMAVLEGGSAAQAISEQLQGYTERLILQFEEECRTLGNGYLSLDVTDYVVTNTDTWFTLRVDAVKTQGGACEFSRFYHIYKPTDEVITLSKLFRPGADYVSALTAEVRRQMNEAMERDDFSGYYPDDFSSIDPEQNFYWNQDNELVLVFDEYTVAAGAEGMPEFVIPLAVYKDLLAF